MKMGFHLSHRHLSDRGPASYHRAVMTHNGPSCLHPLESPLRDNHERIWIVYTLRRRRENLASIKTRRHRISDPPGEVFGGRWCDPIREHRRRRGFPKGWAGWVDPIHDQIRSERAANFLPLFTEVGLVSKSGFSLMFRFWEGGKN